MRKNTLIILVVVALFCIGLFISLSAHNQRNVSYEELKQQAIRDGVASKTQERVSCGTTNPPRCFRYRCDTGFIYIEPIPPPGGVVLRCTDESVIKEIGEVPYSSGM